MLKTLLNSNRMTKRLITICIDSCFVVLAFWSAMFLRLETLDVLFEPVYWLVVKYFACEFTYICKIRFISCGVTILIFEGDVVNYCGRCSINQFLSDSRFSSIQRLYPNRFRLFILP